MTTVYRSTALLLLIAGSLMSQGPINTIPSWDGSAFIASFGVPNTATYGQTISIAPGTAAIASFGFEIGHCTGSVSFRGEVYAWDGAKATGTALFESSPVTVVTASSSYQLVVFSTPGLTLPPGNYVLFATTSRDQAGASAAGCQWASVADTAYPGGYHVYRNNGTNVAQWTSGTWPTLPLDLAFQLNLVSPVNPQATGVPAASPSTLLLGFAGVTALGLLGLSRLRIAR